MTATRNKSGKISQAVQCCGRKFTVNFTVQAMIQVCTSCEAVSSTKKCCNCVLQNGRSAPSRGRERVSGN
jgi:hypothetical protein